MSYSIITNFDFEIISKKVDYKGRFIILKLSIQEQLFTLINVYLPNTEKEQLTFLSDFKKVLIKEKVTNTENVIMGGDWNLIFDNSLDKIGGVENMKYKSLEKLRELMNIIDVNDSWRIKKPVTKKIHLATKKSPYSMSTGFFFDFRPYL